MGNGNLQKVAKDAQDDWQSQQIKPHEPDLFGSGDEGSGAHGADLKSENSGDRPRKAGRPPGSQNKEAAEFAAHLEKVEGMSPLQFLYKTFGTPTKELAKELKMKRGDVRVLQVRAAIAAAPFAHKKLPVEIAVKGGMMNIWLGNAPEADAKIVDAVPFVQLGAAEYLEVEAETNDE